MIARAAFLDECRRWKSRDGRNVSLGRPNGVEDIDADTSEYQLRDTAIDPCTEIETLDLSERVCLALQQLAIE
ncbi:MAG: hypothetical protein ABI601_21660, partial [bacterium]